MVVNLFHAGENSLFVVIALSWLSPFFLSLTLAATNPSLSNKTLQITEKVLSNGLKVVFIEDHKAPIITFQVWYRVGSRNEVLGTTGLSHLVEHLMFKGTDRFGPSELSKIIQKNGGNHNAFTSEDYTTYFANTRKDKIELLLDLESDRMAHLKVHPKDFELEKEVVKEERRLRTETDPVSILVEEMRAMAFTSHPYMWPVVGFMSDLDSITYDDFYLFYRTYYLPNNATIVLGGDIEPEKVFPLLERYFGAINKGENPPKVRAKETEQKGEKRGVIYNSQATLPFLIIGYHAPNFSSPDSFPLEVLSYILFGGKSSRLYKLLVQEKALVLEVDGDYSRLSADPSMFYAYAQPMKAKDPSEIERTILAEIERLVKEPVSSFELEKAKNQIEASLIKLQDNIVYQAMFVGRHYSIGAKKEDIDNYIPKIKEVTPKDIMRVAKKYLSHKNRTIGILLPQGKKN